MAVDHAAELGFRQRAGEPSTTVTAHMPLSVLTRLDALAERRWLSRSAMVGELVRQGLDAAEGEGRQT